MSLNRSRKPMLHAAPRYSKRACASLHCIALPGCNMLKQVETSDIYASGWVKGMFGISEMLTAKYYIYLSDRSHIRYD